MLLGGVLAGIKNRKTPKGIPTVIYHWPLSIFIVWAEQHEWERRAKPSLSIQMRSKWLFSITDEEGVVVIVDYALDVDYY